jgi:cell division inhibitor SulA
MALQKISENNKSGNTSVQHYPSRITQWIVGKNDAGLVDYRSLLLPTLGWQTHHNEQRWVTWVASQFIDKPTLEKFGVNLSSLRMIVDSHSPYSSFKLLLTALKNSRSSMVIASLPSLSPSELMCLEDAAKAGNCRGLIILHD